MEKGSFYGDCVDDMLTKEGPTKLFRHPKTIIQSRFRMLRTIEGNQDILYHFSLLMFRAYERCSHLASRCHDLLSKGTRINQPLDKA
jgi:hypothetical protein